MGNEPHELTELLADFVRGKGADALADDIEQGNATLEDACQRCPNLAPAIRKLADKYTIGWRAVWLGW